MANTDALVRLDDLLPSQCQLVAQGQETVSCRRRHAIVVFCFDELEQSINAVAATTGDNAKFGKVRAERTDQSNALTDQKLARSMQHQDSLLLRVLTSTKRMVGRVTASQIASASWQQMPSAASSSWPMTSLRPWTRWTRAAPPPGVRRCGLYSPLLV